MFRVARYALLAVVVASPSARGQVAPQPPSCTYERCALRVEAVPGSPESSHLVQGIEAKPVEMFGFFRPRIPLFESSPDSVRIPYYAFRDRTAISRGIFGVALGAFVVEAISLPKHRTARPVNILPELGLDLGLGVAGLVEAARAGGALQTAITRYNAALPDR